MENLIKQYKEKYGKKPDLATLQKFYNEQNGIIEPKKESSISTNKTFAQLSLSEKSLLFKGDFVCYGYMADNPDWTLNDFADRYYPVDLQN